MQACNAKIYENGKHVCWLAGANADVIESIVQYAAKRSGFPVDWHYVAGRGNVLTTGDPEVVLKTIQYFLTVQMG